MAHGLRPCVVTIILAKKTYKMGLYKPIMNGRIRLSARFFVYANDIIFRGTSRVGVPRNEQSEFWGFSCASSPTARDVVGKNYGRWLCPSPVFIYNIIPNAP